MMLQQKIGERTKLLSQLEQAKMQEKVSESLRSMSEIAAPGTTPNLEEVRDKIERRYADAMGVGGAGAELGPGPDDGGSASGRADGRAFAAGADPRPMRGESLTSGGTAAPATVHVGQHSWSPSSRSASRRFMGGGTR